MLGAEGPPHILVVDDEPQIRQLLRTVLEREGYRVSVEADGEAALATIQEDHVAVLVTDLKMPRMSGLDLLQAAKTYQPDLGSILITGYASTETAVDALRHGADDFITKPFSLEDLRRVVDRVLATRQMLRHERDALDLARTEAETLRHRSREAEEALATARRDLQVSRRDLERRVHDLEFVNDLTLLLAKEDDLQRIIQTTARILTVRFRARLTRIDVVADDTVYTAQHDGGGPGSRHLAALASDLLERARRSGEGVARDVVLANDRPVEILAAPLDLLSGPAGGITLLRRPPVGQDPGDLSVFALVPRALGVAVEGEFQRRAAFGSALEVASGILEILEGRGSLHRGHADRVARLARAMAEEMGLSHRLQEVVERAARLHDVGEIGVPDGVFQRKGPLTSTELELIRQHPAVGARILAPLGETAALVRHHKERPDGRGYPDGLGASDIPIGSAIVGVAEAFDAMTHHRAWRRSRPRREALAEIARLRDRQFVGDAADALLRLQGRPGAVECD